MKKVTYHTIKLIMLFIGIATGHLTSCTFQSNTPNTDTTATDSSIEEDDDDIDADVDGKHSNRQKNINTDAFKMY